mgnify:CR=1 FL=1
MSFLLFCIGLAIGSFLNVLIDRLPLGESVVWDRSKCDDCKKTLRWWELIPVISFILLGARCNRCHKKLNIRYPVVEIITGAGFAYFGGVISSSVSLVAVLVVFSALLVIFFSDWKYQIIPDSMVIFGSIAALVMVIYISPSLLLPRIAVGLLSSLFFGALWLITQGRGMGMGDVKLVFLLGILLGFPGIIIALYGAFLTGAIVGVILVVARKKSFKSSVAFGPFLVFGTLIALIGKDYILNVWKSIL